MTHERFDFVENVFAAMYSEGSNSDEDINTRVPNSSGDESMEEATCHLGGGPVKSNLPADKG